MQRISSLTVGIVGLVLLLGGGQGWAQGNTAYGTGALPSTAGSVNSAFGFNALHQDTTGSDNTAVGDAALTNNTTGDDNTASGTLESV